MKFKNSVLKLSVTLLIAAAAVVGIYFLFDNVIWLLFKIIGLFLPFIIAYGVSVLVNPLVNKLEKKLKIPRSLSTVIVILLTVGIIGAIVFAVGWKIVDEVQSLYKQLPQLVKNVQSVWNEMSEKTSNIYTNLPADVQTTVADFGDNIIKSVTDFIKHSYTPMVNGIGNFAKALPKVFVWIIVFVLSLYFMVADVKTMRRIIGKCFSKRFLVHVRNVQRELKRYLGGYVKAQLTIMCIASVILLIGLTIMDIQYALLIAVGIAVFDALPFFGSGAVLWPWAAVSFITGDVRRGIGMIIMYLAVMLMRQMIEPKIVSENIGVYPLFTLMSMYVGYKVFSIGGMILGPIILILTVSLYKAGALDGLIGLLKRIWEKIRSDLTELKNFLK